jgi:ribosomal protein S18 acetylase RimI-like enzyme
LKPNRAGADWRAVEANRSALPELQAFYEANPGYWLIAYGHPPRPEDAANDFDARPPAEMPYGEVLSWLIREQPSQRVIGEVSVVVDLLAPGVIHLGFFIVDSTRHGTGFASEVYRGYERWAIEHGARWLRLGVVAGNHRAHAFWRRHGYVEVRRRENYVIGERAHSLIVMAKPVGANTIADYLAAVPRDRPDS